MRLMYAAFADEMSIRERSAQVNKQLKLVEASITSSDARARKVSSGIVSAPKQSPRKQQAFAAQVDGGRQDRGPTNVETECRSS